MTIDRITLKDIFWILYKQKDPRMIFLCTHKIMKKKTVIEHIFFLHAYICLNFISAADIWRNIEELIIYIVLQHNIEIIQQLYI